MNLFDIGMLLVLGICITLGLKNGVIKEAFKIVGIILVFILAYALKGFVGDLFCEFFPFLTFYGKIAGLTSLNVLMYQGIAFLLLFGVFLSIYSTLIRTARFLQKILNATIILVIPSKILGGIIGFVEGVIVLFMIVLCAKIPFGQQDFLKNSKFADKILYQTPILSKATSPLTSSITDTVDLITKVSKKKIDAGEANEKIIESMIKYKVVKESTIQELTNSGKLERTKKEN